jgi:ABC-type Zn uptake system ZnuABC Zn-binding protein ZnuA
LPGNNAEIVGIVPEGVNSHTYEPAPSDARQLAEADVIFINGLKLEEPTLKLAEANLKEGAEIVLLGDQTIMAKTSTPTTSPSPKKRGSPNPHLWPNPFHALRYAEIVRDTLVARDPANAAYYSANYDAFAARIEALDERFKATVASIPEQNRKLLTYHDSWAYFAPRLRHDRDRRDPAGGLCRAVGAGNRRDHPQIRAEQVAGDLRLRGLPVADPGADRPRDRRRSMWTTCATTTCPAHPATPITPISD